MDKGSTFEVINGLLLGINITLQTIQNLGESVYFVICSLMKRIKVLLGR
jgi:hypothetical protein